MPNNTTEQQLIDQATTGDEDAVSQLMWIHYDRLASEISIKLPMSLRRSVEADDILQETFSNAWRHIGDFESRGPDSFYNWIKKIAERKLIDKIRAQGRKKRGGELAKVVSIDGSRSSGLLVELLAGDERTPSSQAAFSESEKAMLIALAGLKDDYRQVIQLRYLDGLPVASVAAHMNRTQGAVEMLCNRAIKKLGTAMGRSSAYLGSR